MSANRNQKSIVRSDVWAGILFFALIEAEYLYYSAVVAPTWGFGGVIWVMGSLFFMLLVMNIFGRILPISVCLGVITFYWFSIFLGEYLFAETVPQESVMIPVLCCVVHCTIQFLIGKFWEIDFFK